MINICLVLNKKYVPQTIVFLNSLFINNENEAFDIYLLHSELEDEQINKLREFIEIKFKHIFTPIKINEKFFKDAPILWNTHSKEAYYKLLIPKIFSDKLDKILYFDIDIIINGSIKELYNTNIENYCLAATGDYYINKKDIEYKKQLGMTKRDTYFNSGVVLFNINKMLENYDIDKIQRYIKDNGKNFHYHDQEVLNKFYYNKCFLFPEKYNCITKFKGVRDFFNYCFEKNNKQKQPIVIHYAGIKPWNILYNAKYLNLFWKYEKGTLSGLDYDNYMKNRKKSIVQVLLRTIYRIIYP